MNNMEIVAQGGANPYTAGSPVEGVSFASEVAAIQGMAGLMAANISKDLSAFWERVSRKFLAIGSLYDDSPITIRLDELELQFDEYKPIKDYLIPDADILVQEDTMQFKGKAQEIQEAVILLQTAQSLVDRFPQALPLAFERFLRAQRIKNVDAWMEAGSPQVEAPPADMAAQLQQMAAGQVPPEEVQTAQA